MIERLEITAIAHATEDPEKVAEAIANLLGLEELPDIEVMEARGHHGNPILYLKLVIRGKEAKKAFENLMKMMDEFEFEILKRELDVRSEGSKLYLRFDKQRAFMGEARLSTGSDVIRIVAVFKGKVTEKSLEKARGSS